MKYETSRYWKKKVRKRKPKERIKEKYGEIPDIGELIKLIRALREVNEEEEKEEEIPIWTDKP